MDPLYLIDTNILVHYVRVDHVWAKVRERYGLFTLDPRPLVSIVTVGELRSLALQFHWGNEKLDKMEFALQHLRQINLDEPDLVGVYASMDADLKSRGFSLGKNDLWIAASAAFSGARLLTTDRDFDPLDPNLPPRDWIDPAPGAP